VAQSLPVARVPEARVEAGERVAASAIGQQMTGLDWSGFHDAHGRFGRNYTCETKVGLAQQGRCLTAATGFLSNRPGFTAKLKTAAW